MRAWRTRPRRQTRAAKQSVPARRLFLEECEPRRLLAGLVHSVSPPPPGIVAGASFGLTVDVHNAQDQLNALYSGNVTVSLANNPGGATLGGTLTVQAVDGVATFSGLTISKPGLGYTLQVTAIGANSITTSTIDVAGYKLVANGSTQDLVWTGTSGSDAVRFLQTDSSTVQIIASELGGAAASFATTVSGAIGRVVVNEYDGPGDADVIDCGGLTSIISAITVGGGNNTLIGGAGNANTITAGNGNNTIYGNGIGTSVNTQDGNNTITVGDGNNTIYGNYGGTGKNAGSNTITVGNGNNHIYGNYGGNGAEGGTNTIVAGNGNNTIYGNAAGDCLVNKAGGDNSIKVGDGNNTIYGNFGGNGADGAEGGDNTINVGNGQNTIYGNFGGSGADGAEGGDNTIVTGKGDDTIYGNFGADGAEGGNNLIVVGGGNAKIYAHAGLPTAKTTVTGGQDLIVVGTGAVTIHGWDASYNLGPTKIGNLVVAGNTNLSIAALQAVLSEWESADSYATRLADISGQNGTAGANADKYLIPGVTVFGSSAVSQVFGTAGTIDDWYLVTSDDLLNQVNPGEVTLVSKTALTAVALTPPSAVVGQTLTNVPIFHFTDPNPGAAASNYSALVTLGDGNTVTLTSAVSPNGQIVASPGGGFDVRLSYLYSNQLANQIFGVQVTSNSGQTAGLSASTFAVGDAPLTAVGVNVSATEGQTLSNVQVATLTDGAGAYSHAADLSAQINWGDGTSSAATLVPTGSGVYAVKGTHTYASYGPYTIGVSYRDVGGSTTNSNSTASVADAPLTAGTLTPLTAIEGRALANVAVFHFTDANPGAVAGDYSALVTLGDGNTVTLTSATSPYGRIVASAGGGFDVQLSYTYSGVLTNQTFGVLVTDNGGQAAARSTNTFSVAYAALTSVGVNITANEGQPFTNVQVATLVDDAGAASQPADLSALIHWGDGASSAATLVPTGSGVYAVQGAHTYAEVGSYTITVNFSNVHGGSTISSSLASVADVPLTAGSLTPPAATAYQRFTNVTVFHFTDANPLATASDFTALVTLGDGNTGTLSSTASPNGQIVASPGGGFDVQLSYTYTAIAGLTNKTFGVQVSDNGGQTTGLSANTLVVAPFVPSNVPNLQLWLDPYDTSTMTLRTVAALNQTAPATQQQYLSASGGGTTDAHGSYPFNFVNSDGAAHSKFSFSGWVYMMDEPGDSQGSQKSPIVSKTMTDGSNGSWWLRFAGTNASLIEFGAYTNGSGSVATAEFVNSGFKNGQWNYVAFAYDGSQAGNANILHVWINGTELAYSTASVGTLPANLQNSSSTSNAFMVGNAFNQFQTSRFADFGFWNGKVFSQSDVNNLYNSGEGLTVNTLANLPAGLQSPFAYYRFNETDGVRADLSGHGYNLAPSSADGSTVGSTLYIEQWNDKAGVCQPFIAGDSTRVGNTHTFQAKRIREPEYQPNGVGPGIPCVTFNSAQWLYSDTANWARVSTGTIFENGARSDLTSGTEDFDFAAFDQTQSTERVFATGYHTPNGSGASLPASWLRIQGNQGGADLVSNNGTSSSATISSASYTFTSNDIGKQIHITGSGSWTDQTVYIVSVSGGAATVNVALGSAASLSGGVWTMLSGGSSVTTLDHSALLPGDIYPVVGQFVSREFACVDTSTGSGSLAGPWRQYINGQQQTVYVADGGNGHNLPNGWTTIVPSQTGLGINCFDQGNGSLSSGTNGGTLSEGDIVSFAPMISTTADAVMRTWLASRLLPPPPG